MNRFVNVSKVRKQFLLLILLITGYYFHQWYWGSGWGKEKNVASIPRSLTSQTPDFDEYVVDYIRTHHIVHHDPSRPTNYSGARDDWEKQSMSSFIAKHLNSKRNGFFLECGALDGVFLSNTLHLERSFGWTGLLVEADPGPFRRLKERNRHALISNACISVKPYPIKVGMFRHKEWDGVSYIKIDPREKARDSSFNSTFQVQCFPFRMLMAASNRTEIDYLSLDVEGVELLILKTIPFDKIRIKLISVEVNKGNSKIEIQQFLEPFGYKRIKEFRSFPEYLYDDLYELQPDH